MCFNDPWGASLAGCWTDDELSVTGPSATLLRAYDNALAATGQKAPPRQRRSQPLPLPIHGPVPLRGAGDLSASASPSPSPMPLPVNLPLPH